MWFLRALRGRICGTFAWLALELDLPLNRRARLLRALTRCQHESHAHVG